WGVSDALYMVAITISGVGYGEVRPVLTPIARIHTVAVMTLGMLAVGYTLGRFIQFLTEGAIQNLVGHHGMKVKIDALKDHIIVVGFGRMGALLCKELTEHGLPVVVIEQAADILTEIESRGYLHIHGDATEEKALTQAGLLRARVLVTAVPNDA